MSASKLAREFACFFAARTTPDNATEVLSQLNLPNVRRAIHYIGNMVFAREEDVSQAAAHDYFLFNGFEQYRMDHRCGKVFYPVHLGCLPCLSGNDRPHDIAVFLHSIGVRLSLSDYNEYYYGNVDADNIQMMQLDSFVRKNCISTASVPSDPDARCVIPK